MTQRRSMRRRVFGVNTTPSELGEAVSDLADIVEASPRLRVVDVSNVRWSVPFSFEFSSRPVIVLLADARASGSLETAATSIGALQWTYVTGRVRIDSAPTLTAGNAYDLQFLVVF